MRQRTLKEIAAAGLAHCLRWAMWQNTLDGCGFSGRIVAPAMVAELRHPGELSDRDGVIRAEGLPVGSLDHASAEQFAGGKIVAIARIEVG